MVAKTNSHCTCRELNPSRLTCSFVTKLTDLSLGTKVLNFSVFYFVVIVVCRIFSNKDAHKMSTNWQYNAVHKNTQWHHRRGHHHMNWHESSASQYNLNFEQQVSSHVFWVVMPHSVVVGYQYFGGICCFHLLGWRQQGPPKSWCRPTATLHGITNQKTLT